MDRLPRSPFSPASSKRAKLDATQGAASHSASPSSRPNTEGALRFPFSPRQINRPAALELKHRDPSLHLLMTSCADVCPEEENSECLPGFMFSVWPLPTGRTDKLLEELSALREEVTELKIYSVLCGTSVLVCAGDVINFVLKILDHSLKTEVACFPHSESILVGEHGKKPFLTSIGDGIRYTILLKFIAYLRADLDQGKEAGAEDHDLLSSCLLLLERAEKRVFGIIMAQRFVVKDSDGKVIEETAFLSSLREDIIRYSNLEGLWCEGREGRQNRTISSISKDQRDESAHPFSTLIWTEYKKPLGRTSDPFPVPSSMHFRDRNLAKAALLLQDLESKFHTNELGLEAEYITLLPLGFLLIKTFIKRHNTVERNVTYKKIQAVIPGQVRDKNLPALVLSDPKKKAICFDATDA